MVTITDSWRLADRAQVAVRDAVERATLAAIKGDQEMAWLWLHSARRSAEALVRHLERAADEAQPGSYDPVEAGATTSTGTGVGVAGIAR